MRNRYWISGAKMIALVAVALLVFGSEVQAQSLGRKTLPTLSLVKVNQSGQNDVLANDTQYVAEAGPGETRYFLMPIFIKNCLDPQTDPVTGFPGERIYSFKFKLQYNRTLIHAVGVEKRGPMPFDTTVLAHDFNLSWDVDDDATYKKPTTGAPSANGERIMVTGSSSIALPQTRSTIPNQTACQFRDTSVFLYVKFEVVGTSAGGSAGANRDQVILDRDSIWWNSYRVVDVTPEMANRGFEQYQAGVAPSPVIPITYPNNYGSAIVVVTERPRIDLFPTSLVRQVQGDPSNYELITPLQTQYGNPNAIVSNLILLNGIASTYLRNVTVETDEPWLRVSDTIPPGFPGGQPGQGERGVFIRQVGEQAYFNVIANPSLLPTSDGSGYPTPGIYTGYVTVRSSDAINSAVRLRVTLIVNRNPLEDALDTTQESTRTRGIRLLVRNSAALPDTTYLTFGTGIGATTGVDSLFGEAEAANPPNQNQFFARFFPPGHDLTDGFNGMVDTRGIPPSATNSEKSIDIRPYNATTTLTYCVRFSTGGPSSYPLVIEYDETDFPQGAQLFIRDNANGLIFSEDLRKSTSLGGTRHAFYIKDPNTTGFCIEYTLPRVVQFPEINPGWNLVSLPVRPSDNRSGTVFANANTKPLRFYSGFYTAEDTVAVGFGYFVKYGDILDRTVAGVPFYHINSQVPPIFEVAVARGWNTVGALSVPTTTDFITFAPPRSGGTGVPVLTGEVYRYVTREGYQLVSRLDPGFGYWIKVDKQGYYHLDAPPNALPPSGKAAARPFEALSRLNVSDNAQHVGTLWFGREKNGIDEAHYEMPPVPGHGMFDARFDNNGMVSVANSSDESHVVNFDGVTYPVVVSVDRADADYVLTDANTGAVLGSFSAGQAGAVTVTNPMTKSVRISSVASKSINLTAAYPNPTSGRASFDISVPSEQFVTVTLHNTVGAEVRELFRGTVDGQKSVEFSTDGLPSGAYYYVLKTASGETVMHQITVTK